MARLVWAVMVVAMGCGNGAESDDGPPPVSDATPVPDAAEPAFTDAICSEAITPVPTELGLDPFYDQYLDVGGIPLIASSAVDPAAFPIACEIMVHMLALRPDIRRELRDNEIRVGIMAVSEVTTDMPEHSDLDEAFPETDWDTRARGLGATLVRPLSSVGEENLLELESDPYLGESIMVHEFAHTIFITGLITQTAHASLDSELETLYQDALTAGTWQDTYAATNRQEYFAEAVQSFYDTNLEADPADGVHGPIDTRAELATEDPAIYTFVTAIFDEDDPWRP